MHNTFVYRHSDLPPVRPEIQAEIVALDVQVADLILKSQGNYKELEQLAEILDNCLDSCELNLNSIRIIPDEGSPQSDTISMRDLPIEQKQLIYSCSRTNSILLNVLSEITGQPCEKLAHDIGLQASIQARPVVNEEIEQFINDVMMPLTERVKNNPQAKIHYVLKEVN